MTPPEPLSAAAAEAAWNDYVAAWNSRRGAALVAALAPGGTYVDPMLPGPLSGDALAGYVDALAASTPDLALVSDQLSIDGSRLWASWHMTGTWTGPFPGLPEPTGAAWEIRGVDVVAVGAEGLTEIVGYFDSGAFLRSLGLSVAVGPPA